MKQTTTKANCTWTVMPLHIKLEVKDKENNYNLVDAVWDKDEFWRQIFELKKYCEERGEIIKYDITS